MKPAKSDLPQGALDLLILKVVALGPSPSKSAVPAEPWTLYGRSGADAGRSGEPRPRLSAEREGPRCEPSCIRCAFSSRSSRDCKLRHALLQRDDYCPGDDRLGARVHGSVRRDFPVRKPAYQRDGHTSRDERERISPVAPHVLSGDVAVRDRTCDRVGSVIRRRRRAQLSTGRRPSKRPGYLSARNFSDGDCGRARLRLASASRRAVRPCRVAAIRVTPRAEA